MRRSMRRALEADEELFSRFEHDDTLGGDERAPPAKRRRSARTASRGRLAKRRMDDQDEQDVVKVTRREIRATRRVAREAQQSVKDEDVVGIRDAKEGERTDDDEGLDAFGEPIEDDEERLDAFGDPVEDDEERLDAFGDPVEDDEERLDAFGDPVEDDEERLDAFGDLVEDGEERIDVFGDPVKESGVEEQAAVADRVEGEAGPKGKRKALAREVKKLQHTPNFAYRVRTYPNGPYEYRRKEHPPRRVASMRYK